LREGLKKEEAQHPVQQIGSAFRPVDVNSILQSPNLQNAEINATDAIEAATGNLNNADDATINVNLPATPAAPTVYFELFNNKNNHYL
jgi:hypothetical protein